MIILIYSLPTLLFLMTLPTRMIHPVVSLPILCLTSRDLLFHPCFTNSGSILLLLILSFKSFTTPKILFFFFFHFPNITFCALSSSSLIGSFWQFLDLTEMSYPLWHSLSSIIQHFNSSLLSFLDTYLVKLQINDVCLDFDSELQNYTGQNHATMLTFHYEFMTINFKWTLKTT